MRNHSTVLHERHLANVRTRCHAFYSEFTYEEQEALAKEMVNWPRYKPGYFFPKVRRKICHVLNLDPSRKYSIQKCNLWIESVGFYFIGRNTHAVETEDGETLVFGPAPSNCRQDSELEFPYSDATYHEDTDTWTLPKHHELYTEFFTKKKINAA